MGRPRHMRFPRAAAVRVIGSVSLALGTALAAMPERTSEALGLPHSPWWTPVLGVADGVLGVALLSGRRQRRWMYVRAVANLGLAGVYAWHLASSAHPGRTRAGMLGMAMITVTDGALARSLPPQPIPD